MKGTSSMELIRAKIELDYDNLKILCFHYAHNKEEPTIIEIDGQERSGGIQVYKNGDSYIIKIDIKA